MPGSWRLEVESSYFAPRSSQGFDLLSGFGRELFEHETIRFYDEIPPFPVAEAGEAFVVYPFVFGQIRGRRKAAPSDQFFKVFRSGLERPRDRDLVGAKYEKHLVANAEAEVIVPFDGFGDTFEAKAVGADFGWVHFLFFTKLQNPRQKIREFLDNLPPMRSSSKLFRLHFQFVKDDSLIFRLGQASELGNDEFAVFIDHEWSIAC